MPARLVSLNTQADIPLEGILTLIGRDHSCDVRIDSSRISRMHCCLAARDDKVAVRDLASTNGTWVNGQRAELGAASGTATNFRIAHLRYRLEITGNSANGENMDR